MTNKLMHLENVYKYYGTTKILGNIDLKINEGEFLTVVGKSGCGKSTLLRIILGQESATSGKVLIDGNVIGKPDTSRGIVYQHYSLADNLTVLENIMRFYTLSVNPITAFFNKKKYATLVEPYIKAVNLWQHRDKFPAELSGGMRQRAAIAQVLVSKPKILLMDEPFGALDTGTRMDLQRFLIELWERENMTILFVTHDLDEAIQISSRVICLSDLYTDDRGIISDRGAKIVYDADMRHIPLESTSIHRPDVIEIHNKLFTAGFDPNQIQHVKDFDLTHADSFQTLTTQEYSSTITK